MEIFSILLSISAISFGIWSWYKSNKIQNRIKENITKNSNLITSTTDLLEVSAKIGIKAAHVNRQIAIQKIEERLMEEEKFIVVGSSLKGLKMFLPHLDQIIKSRAELNLENRFLLTHPCFSRSREIKAGGDIVMEIEEMANFLIHSGISECDIRYYLGTPTNFLIITSDLMLINPYPYQMEAFKCFCLEVERKPIENVKEKMIKNFPKAEQREVQKFEDIIKKEWLADFKEEIKNQPMYNYTFDIADDIYGQYYWYHYMLPWYSKSAITYEDFKSNCKSCIKECIDTGKQGKCIFYGGSSCSKSTKMSKNDNNNNSIQTN